MRAERFGRGLPAQAVTVREVHSLKVSVFGLVKLNPDLFWPAVLVATAGIKPGR